MPYSHFDSVWDFLINQDKITPGREVSFSSTMWIVSKRENKESETLELVVSDDSGQASVLYHYNPELIELRKRSEIYGDPLYWSLEGDGVRILLANYQVGSTLVLQSGLGLLFTLNDNHYRRFLNSGNVLLREAAKR